MSNRSKKKNPFIIIAGLIVVAVGAAGYLPTLASEVEAVMSDSPALIEQEEAVLNTGSVAPEFSADIETAISGLYNAPQPGTVTEAYDRKEHFGNGWTTTDGCSTRETVLMRDLDDVVMRDDRGCKVLSGTIYADLYTGEMIEFNSIDDPQAVQIDHVVPLSVAWEMGANEWSYEERVEFSNDTLNLYAVDGPANNSKGDRTPERWMPANEAFHCEYAHTYATVTTVWGLAIELPVRDALIEVLEAC